MRLDLGEDNRSESSGDSIPVADYDEEDYEWVPRREQPGAWYQNDPVFRFMHNEADPIDNSPYY